MFENGSRKVGLIYFFNCFLAAPQPILGYYIVCTKPNLQLQPPQLNLQPNFQNGGIDRTSTFRSGLLGKRGLTFKRGGGGGAGLQFSQKKKIKI